MNIYTACFKSRNLAGMSQNKECHFSWHASRGGSAETGLVIYSEECGCISQVRKVCFQVPFHEGDPSTTLSHAFISAPMCGLHAEGDMWAHLHDWVGRQ